MYDSARTFIDQLGGYRAVAVRLRLSSTTLHTHMSTGVLPSKWYDALLKLSGERGIEPPPRTLFAFMALPKSTENVATVLSDEEAA